MTAGSTVFNKGKAEWKPASSWSLFGSCATKFRLIWTKLVIYIDEKSMTNKINFHQMSSCHAVALRCQLSCQTLWRMMQPGQLAFERGSLQLGLRPFYPSSQNHVKWKMRIRRFIRIYFCIFICLYIFKYIDISYQWKAESYVESLADLGEHVLLKPMGDESKKDEHIF